MNPEKSSKVSPSSASGKIKPTFIHRVFAWPISTNWSAGLLLFASFWLPHVRGCDGGTIVPVDDVQAAIQDNRIIEAGLSTWPYLMGFTLAIGMVVSALFALHFADKLLFGIQALFYGAVWASAWIVELQRIDPADRAKAAMIFAFQQVPFHLLALFWCGLAIGRRDWATAWARLATIMIVLAGCWMYLSMLFAQAYYYGYYVAILGLVGMLVGPWFFRVHWQRLLIATDASKRPLRFRILHFLVASGLIAALYGYFRYLPKLLGE